MAKELGASLNDYASILEKERRIDQYYKSYVERGGTPDRFNFKNKVNGYFDYNLTPNKELWDNFVGGYNSGTEYMPNLG